MASREDDLAGITAELKKFNDDNKRANMARLAKSSSAADRELAASWKKELDSDTSTMVQTNRGTGRRIGADGRAVGEELRKLDSGGYDTGKPVKKAKGGKVSSASKRADGVAQRGKTKGKMY